MKQEMRGEGEMGFAEYYSSIRKPVATFFRMETRLAI